MEEEELEVEVQEAGHQVVELLQAEEELHLSNFQISRHVLKNQYNLFFLHVFKCLALCWYK